MRRIWRRCRTPAATMRDSAQRSKRAFAPRFGSAIVRRVPGSAAASPSERERAHALILSHGWNATAFQTLESGYRYFFPNDDACVAYVDTGRAWVAAGAPIAPDVRIADAIDEFLRAA